MACLAPPPAAAAAHPWPPIEFFYSHLHDSIRGELQTLSDAVLHLEQSNNLVEQLWHLRERYRFLGQVYKYHSSVEDEVVYPALDSKVRNVTLAYSVEHEDEVRRQQDLSQGLDLGLLDRPFSVGKSAEVVYGWCGWCAVGVRGPCVVVLVTFGCLEARTRSKSVWRGQ